MRGDNHGTLQIRDLDPVVIVSFRKREGSSRHKVEASGISFFNMTLTFRIGYRTL
jgi:hypothetical protein